MASIRKRLLPARKDGARTLVYVVDYVDRAGRRRRKQFDRRKDAAAFRDHAGVGVRQGTHVPDRETVTVAEAARVWLAACAVGRQGRHPVEPQTYRGYESHVRVHIAPRLGKVRLNRLTKPMVAEFRDWMLENHSRHVARSVLTSFRALLSEAQARGLAGTNPAAGVAVRASQRHRERLTIPTRAEVRAILSYASTARQAPQERLARAWHRNHTLLMTAALTGLRASELRGLYWETGVDLAGRTLHVVQRADQGGVIGPRSRPRAGATSTSPRPWSRPCASGSWPARRARWCSRTGRAT